MGVSSSAALAQEGPPTVNQPAVAEQPRGATEDTREQAKDIVVTGSLIRGLPKEYVASPVFTYGKADIARSGAASLSQYMLSIPQNFTGDLSDFGSSASSIGTTLGSGTTYNQYDGFASFALRGLASDATLTLLNGRRMASVGMIESPTVSVLPSALIERIDIISDGASATYGADAVAGVVNIITRKPKAGLELRLRGATATETGAKNWEASALTGHSWSSGSIYGMAMYQKRQAYVEDPIVADGTRLQITQLPNETVSGFYGGIRQEAGNLTFSVDASRFQRDRDAMRNYPDFPRYNRLYKAKTTGFSINGTAHWQGDGTTSVDLNIDYGRNKSSSSLFSGAGPYITPSTRYDYTNSLLTAELSGQTSPFSLPAGPVIVAGGVQYRREELTTTAKIFFNRNGGTRTTKSIFGEVNVPLIGSEQAVPLVRSLSLSAASRYEDLGFDHAFAPKVGLRWQVDRSIALRGTYARSFLVPRFRDTIGIAEQVSFWNYSYAFLDPQNQNPLLPAGNAVVMYRSGANPDLKTQKADTFTAGLDLTPTMIPGLTIKTGYYRIRITGRVVTPSQDDSVSVPALQAFNTRNPTAAEVASIVNNPAVAKFFTSDLPFYTGGEDAIYTSPGQIPAALLANVQAIADIRPQNYAVETTDGIDLDLTYRGRLLGGDIAVRLTGQYILDLSLSAPGGQAVSRLDGYAQPSDVRLNGTLVWGRGGVSGGTVVNYVNGFTDNRPGRTETRIKSYTTVTAFLGFDLSRLFSAPVFKDSEVQFVLTNIFNAHPPQIVDAVLGFDPYNNPPNPRTIGLTLTKRFN
ncbi:MULTISPECIES: TonB-dependent receptor plug domain-containing protein [unclassified Sphingobium]|uniref:TonB-dependent receptor plug domain-containing protein n=1 Tax=unclassified Sphingobium TaxID=2611147 RepID=UPI002225B3C9|nr:MULTISPECIES: TonB-dependent receptor [unclassified Sphingobium]MCW2413466.1 iron complex outermembrane receptor protein [Sphingobium sp. B8D3D]MCW2414235.1 iron complex outermembrane receptor protein [Sphingobium sp. B8D3A]